MIRCIRGKPIDYLLKSEQAAVRQIAVNGFMHATGLIVKYSDPEDFVELDEDVETNIERILVPRSLRNIVLRVCQSPRHSRNNAPRPTKFCLDRDGERH